MQVDQDFVMDLGTRQLLAALAALAEQRNSVQ
jgi:hypothetical protein